MRIRDYISGDSFLWALVLILPIFSFLPVYSASSNLAYLNGGEGNTLQYVVKHFAHLILGLGIAYTFHKIPYNYFKGLSFIMLALFAWISGNIIFADYLNVMYIPIA